jgi:hypothetical protein
MGVLTTTGVTTPIGVWTAATGDGVLRIGASAGGLAGGGVADDGPEATATGADVGGGEVGCGREAGLAARRGGDVCLPEGRVAAIRIGVGRADPVGMPAATDALGLNETGVAVKRAAPKTEVGATNEGVFTDALVPVEPAAPRTA